MAGMRDRLLHGYDKIDWTLVWEVLQRRVPELLSMLEPLVPPEP